jgi:hypothetical protein
MRRNGRSLNIGRNSSPNHGNSLVPIISKLKRLTGCGLAVKGPSTEVSVRDVTPTNQMDGRLAACVKISAFAVEWTCKFGENIPKDDIQSIFS